MNDDLPPGFDEIYTRYRDNGGGPGAPILKPISLAELRNMTFTAPAAVVPGLFVEGLTLLAGKPKVGKSFLVLHVAIAVGAAGETLGVAIAEEGDVLYCALEDTLGRLHRRVTKLDTGWPDRYQVLTQMPRISAGGLGVIRSWCDSVPRPRLIIIDTLELIRDRSSRANENGYATDYAAVQELRKLAQDRHLAVVVVHHLRKAEADDPFDTVSGTLGLTGAPDAILVLARNSSGGYTLHGKGRELEEIERPIAFDKTTCLWTLQAGGVSPSKDPWQKRPTLTLLHRVLTNALADHGANLRPWPNAPAVRAVDQELLRFEFYKLHPAPEVEVASQRSQARQRAFKRAINDALNAGLVGSKEIDGKVMLWMGTPMQT